MARNIILEPARETPVLETAEVLVIGSGPAGLCAAIAAARNGVDVLLIERFGCFGGNLTHVGVEGIAWYRHPQTVDVEGLGIELEQKAKDFGASTPEIQSNSEAIDAELFKSVADSWLLENKVRMLLHTLVVDVVLEDQKITGIIVQNKSGRHAILAQQIIDASGDADLAHLAGAPVQKTAKEEMMAVTVMFSCSGVERSRFLDYVKENPQRYKDWRDEWAMKTSGKEDELFSPYLPQPFDKARETGLIPEGLKSIGGTFSTVNEQGEASYLNMIHLSNIDGTDVYDLTKGEMEGRRQALLAIAALKKFTPGFENVKLRNFGMTIGIRDTRKIQGEYELTGHDVNNQATFDDSIGIFPEFIDGYGHLILPTTGRYYQLPYRSLLPLGIENLLVAGRAIAGDKVSHASIRNMMCCTVTGQAAGAAAALAVKSQVTVRNLSVNDLQQELKRQGVRIH